jgi:hypothetical protein
MMADHVSKVKTGFPGVYSWDIVPGHAKHVQEEQARRFVERDGGYRKFLGSPDAPLDLRHLFVGCNLVHEFIDNEFIEVAGLRVTGHRGIPYIYGGWNDEVMRADLLDRARRMPNADLFLTHYPPLGILDGGPLAYGLEGLAAVLQGKMDGPVGVHCFGHIHESRAVHRPSDSIVFSNAATYFNVIDI